MPVATLTSVPSVYPFLLTTLAPLAAAAASMLNERSMVTGWAVSPAFLITMSYSRESARMVTSHLYSRPSMPVSMFLKIMRSKDTFLARSSVGRCTYVRWATEKVFFASLQKLLSFRYLVRSVRQEGSWSWGTCGLCWRRR